MDEWFLQRAVELADHNVTCGDGGPFGAVIVREGQIVAEGRNLVIATKDPTAHAEIVAIRAACQKLQSFHLPDCVLYASSEPCPMCLAAACWARVQRIVFANARCEAAAIGFCDDDLYRELNTSCSERRIPTLHLPVAGAREPLQRWFAQSNKINY